MELARRFDALVAPRATDPEDRAETRESLASEVYRAHFDTVWRTLRRLGVLEHAVEDAIQDVLIVVHRRSAEYDGSSALKTWVIGIALRVAANHRRTQRRDAARLTAFAAEGSPSPREPEQLAAEREAVATLHALLERLPENQRELLVLVDLEQLSVAEAALVTGTTPSACYKRLAAEIGRAHV